MQLLRMQLPFTTFYVEKACSFATQSPITALAFPSPLSTPSPLSKGNRLLSIQLACVRCIWFPHSIILTGTELRRLLGRKSVQKTSPRDIFNPRLLAGKPDRSLWLAVIWSPSVEGPRFEHMSKKQDFWKNGFPREWSSTFPSTKTGNQGLEGPCAKTRRLGDGFPREWSSKQNSNQNLCLLIGVPFSEKAQPKNSSPTLRRLFADLPLGPCRHQLVSLASPPMEPGRGKGPENPSSNASSRLL